MTIAKRTSPSTAKPRTGARAPIRSKAAQFQDDLLGIVYQVVAEQGIDGASMRMIAQAAGVSTGSINYHFTNKHNLVIAALEAAYALPDDWERYRGSPLRQLKRLLEGYVFRSERDRFWLFWLNYVAESTRDEEMRRRLQQRYERQQRFWASLLRDAVAAREVRAGIDADAVAERLLLMSHGLVVRQVQAPDAATRARTREILDRAIAEISDTPSAR